MAYFGGNRFGLHGVVENDDFNSTKLFAFLMASYGCKVSNKTEFLDSAKLTEEEFQENPIINWDAILWVNRSTELWAVQLVLALVSLTEALLIAYLGYKVSSRFGLLGCSAKVIYRSTNPSGICRETFRRLVGKLENRND